MSMVEIKVAKKRFIDLDLGLAKHPISGDITKKVNENAILTSVRNLVLTKMYDRPFHPEISSQVNDLLFEPLTIDTAEVLKRAINYVITNFEPRVEVLLIDVKDTPDNSEILVTIVARLIGAIDTIKTQFYLQRLL